MWIGEEPEQNLARIFKLNNLAYVLKFKVIIWRQSANQDDWPVVNNQLTNRNNV